jgi:tetratricopeptide (TPR) repeat protein
LWEAWVLNDFDVLEKRKITQPAMAHIRTWMEDARLVAARQKADANPNDKDAISQWRNLARDYKRWPDAVSAEQRLLKLIQADPAHTKAELLDAYLGLSWYQLFVRDFAGALASTDSGLAIDPTYLPLETNRAHALLFLNRVAAADAIYRGNIGKKMPGSGDAWETVILDDLKQLEAGGLKHPEIARLRTLMSAARK